jgi:SPP1 family predicted phage head-tail adaptor
MIRSGKYRHYANIEQAVVSGTGPRGQPVIVWTVFLANTPLAIVPLSGRMLEITRQLVATATHRVELRYLPGIEAGMRVNFEGRYLNIGFVDEMDFKRHDMALVCTEETEGASPR